MQISETVKRAVGSIGVCVERAMVTEKKFKMHKLHDGSTIFDFELPAPNMLEGQPLVATGKLTRRWPVIGGWQVNRDSIEVIGY